MISLRGGSVLTALRHHVLEITLPLPEEKRERGTLSKLCKFEDGHEGLRAGRVDYVAREKIETSLRVWAIHAVSFSEPLQYISFKKQLRFLRFRPAGILSLFAVSLIYPDWQKYIRIICGADFCIDTTQEDCAYMFMLGTDETGQKRKLDLHPLEKAIEEYTYMLCIPLGSNT